MMTIRPVMKEPPMTAATTVPVTIEPAAAAYLAKLGLQVELEKILEHTRQVVPDLTRIRVALEPIYEPGFDQILVIEAYVDPDSKQDVGALLWPWNKWMIANFPYEVFHYFTLSFPIDVNHGG
jgi:hypothetical protein